MVITKKFVKYIYMTQSKSDKKALDEFSLMRQIYDNLEYLDYESEFDPVSRHFPYLTPYYFALPGQSGKEQFDYFAALSIWLLQKYHKSDISTPSDLDDPSQIADNIMLALPAADGRRTSRCRAAAVCVRVQNGYAVGPGKHEVRRSTQC